MQKNANLTEYVKEIRLPKKNEKVPVKSQCFVAGWGMTRSNSLASDVLREAAVEMEDNASCKYKWRIHFDMKQMICTRTNNGRGICQVSYILSVDVFVGVCTQ